MENFIQRGAIWQKHYISSYIWKGAIWIWPGAIWFWPGAIWPGAIWTNKSLTVQTVDLLDQTAKNSRMKQFTLSFCKK